MEDCFSFEEIQVSTINDEDEEMRTPDPKFFWNPDKTKLLLEIIKKYKPTVGTAKVRTLKTMWKLISTELSEILKTAVSAKHCENRWRVLQRSYRSCLKSLRAGQRKECNFFEELRQLFGKKNNLHSNLLHFSESMDYPSLQNSDEEKLGLIKEVQESSRVTKTNKIPVASFLLKIKEERIRIQKEKLELKRQKLQAYTKRNELMQQYIDLLKNNHTCQCKTTEQ